VVIKMCLCFTSCESDTEERRGVTLVQADLWNQKDAGVWLVSVWQVCACVLVCSF